MQGEVNAYDKRGPSEIVKDIMGKLIMRDGFKISTGISYVIEDWNNTRFALGDIQEKADALRSSMSDTQRERFCDRSIQPSSDWINNPQYSPDRAEQFRPTMD